uniref:Uncharacterized protein n=1 Tax=Oryza meridionalis TaxID=40149 RepID=A0A0E0EXX8_9ORYZ
MAMPNSWGIISCDGVVYVADGHDKAKNTFCSSYMYDVATDTLVTSSHPRSVTSGWCSLAATENEQQLCRFRWLDLSTEARLKTMLLVG